MIVCKSKRLCKISLYNEIGVDNALPFGVDSAPPFGSMYMYVIYIIYTW